MRVEVFNVFVVAAGEVLATEADVKPIRGQLDLQRDAYVTDDVTVLLSLVGDVWGVAILSLSFDFAKAIISRMLGQDVTEFDELAQSGISELGNVIMGQATTRMAQLGLDADISVPTLIVGKGSRISTLDIDRLIVPLETELGILRLSLALRESKGGERPANGAKASVPIQVAM